MGIFRVWDRLRLVFGWRSRGRSFPLCSFYWAINIGWSRLNRSLNRIRRKRNDSRYLEFHFYRAFFRSLHRHCGSPAGGINKGILYGWWWCFSICQRNGNSSRLDECGDVYFDGRFTGNEWIRWFPSSDGMDRWVCSPDSPNGPFFAEVWKGDGPRFYR